MAGAAHVAAHPRRGVQLARSPDALLGTLFAKCGAFAHPQDAVDLLGGRPSPLTIYGIPYGPPGIGKTSVVDLAEELLPVPEHAALDGFIVTVPSTGEGLLEAYYGFRERREDEPKGPPRRDIVRRRVLFKHDEGEAFIQQTIGRPGATGIQVVRSMWMGAHQGTQNAAADKQRNLPKRSYSLGLILGFQPDTIGPLFDRQRAGGGTPHRFLYAATDHPDHPEERPPWPGVLELPDRPVRGHGTLAGTEPVTVRLGDAQIRAQLDARERAIGVRSLEIDEKDTHTDLMRGRVAAHLALWDDRDTITVEDWELAGMVTATSAAVRDSAMAYGKRLAAEERAGQDRRKVRRATHAARQVRAEEEIERAAAQLVRAVAGAPGQEITTGKALNRIRSDLRHRSDDAMRKAVADGRLILVDDGKRLAFPPAEGRDDD